MTNSTLPTESLNAGALAGLKVLDLSRFIAGPYCTMMLADMGADVVKIEKPGDGDITRSYQPQVGGTSLYSMVFNRNKRSLTLDVRTPEGQQQLRALIAQADVLVENFRPGVMEKMGCGWESLHALNPRLIMARVSGFGQDGPYAEKPCFDVIAQAMGGLMEVTGAPDGPPTVAGTYICDYTTAMYTCIGVLGALAARERTGLGQLVDVALFDCATSMLLTAIPEKVLLGRDTTRRGNTDRYGAPNNTYRTADDDWVHIAAGTLYARFFTAIGRAELIDDERYNSIPQRLKNRESLDKIAGDWIRSTATADVLALMERYEVPCAKVATISDVLDNPQLRHRGQITEVQHPGIGAVPMQGVTIRLSGTPLTIRHGQPPVGADTTAVLHDWLGAAA